MSKPKFTKEEIEYAIADKFLEYFNRHCWTIISILRNGEQGKINEPDIVCSHSLYIEIVRSSYGQNITEAQRYIERQNVLWNSNEVVDRWRTDWFKISAQWTQLQNPDKKAFFTLTRTIEKKFSKKYDVPRDHELILLIYVDTALSTAQDFIKYLRTSYTITNTNQSFKEIWYIGIHTLADPRIGIGDDEWDIFRIFPSHDVIGIATS